MKKNFKDKEQELENKAEMEFVGLGDKIGGNKKWFIFSIVAAAIITAIIVAVLIVTKSI